MPILKEMTQGIILLPIIPVRSEPSGKATMTNQLLYGDLVYIKEALPNSWLKIISQHDDYEGYCEANQISTDLNVISGINYVTSTIAVIAGTSRNYTLPFGSRIAMDAAGKPILEGENAHTLFGTLSDRIAYTGEPVVSLARSFEGAPYLWGGRSVFGIDCSGLVQVVFSVTDINLPRDAWQQAAAEGQYIDLIEETQAGDVAFFDNEEGKITHTGILTGNKEIIHASGRVRVDPIDHYGIFNRELGDYSHKLRVIKRFASHIINDLLT